MKFLDRQMANGRAVFRQQAAQREVPRKPLVSAVLRDHGMSVLLRS